MLMRTPVYWESYELWQQEHLTLQDVRDQSQPLRLAQRQNQSSEITVNRVEIAKLANRSNIAGPVSAGFEAARVSQTLVSMSLERVSRAEAMSGIL